MGVIFCVYTVKVEGQRFMEQDKIKEFALFQVRRKITNIYKNFFFIIEDLQDNGYNINDETYTKIRKRILDHANDAIRELEEQFQALDIKLKWK